MIRISVLGPVRAERGGEPLDLGGPTQRRLLATLVARHDEVVAVSDLLEALWGDDPPPSGPGSIQAYVSRLRRELGADLIETAAPGYRFNTPNAEVDAVRFQEARQNLPHERQARIREIKAVLELWSGAPYEGIEGLDGMARRLVETRLELEEQLASDLAEEGHVAEAVGVLERMTTIEPLREVSWIQLAGTLSNGGRHAEAVRALNRYRENVADLGLEPSNEFIEFENRLFETPAPPPPRRVVTKPSTSFVGRANEKRQLGDLIAAERLVSVLGPGGMGKTRLGLEVLAEVENANVWVVPLAGTNSGAGVAPAILRSIGLESRGDPVVAVLRALNDGDIVFLDNCEHVIEGAASVAAAITEQTSASVFATSREPLNVAGETIVALGPLDRASASTLYEERASSVNPEFAADPDQIADLCEMLDLMPLAIEIAASRSLALGPADIAANLDREYSILRRPMRGGEARHETLNSLVQWSYDLMPPETRRLFERLSVFAGRFDIDAAKSVAGFAELANESIPALLADLVERSMVARVDGGYYRMLHVLKSFAAQLVRKSGDFEQAMDRHTAYFSSLAPEIGEGIASGAELDWLDVANRSVEDMGLALDWAVNDSNLDACRQILEGLFDWFYHRQPPELMGWGAKVLAVSEGHPVFPVAAAWAALASLKRNEIDEARAVAQLGIDFGDHPATRYAWFMAGDVACYTGELDFARSAFDHQLVRASNEGDKIGVIDAIGGEVLALSYQGFYEEAYAIAQGIEPAAQATGSPTYIAFAQYTLGETLVEADPEQARRRLMAAVDTASSVNNKLIEGMARTAMGPLLANNGDLEEATEQMVQALGVYLDLGANAYAWTALRYLALIGGRAGRDEVVIKIIAAAETNGRRPYGVEEEEWDQLKARLATNSDYQTWWSNGAAMDLQVVAAAALDAFDSS